MGDTAIRVEGLGKQYRIGTLRKNGAPYNYKSLREPRKLWRRTSSTAPDSSSTRGSNSCETRTRLSILQAIQGEPGAADIGIRMSERRAIEVRIAACPIA